MPKLNHQRSIQPAVQTLIENPQFDRTRTLATLTQHSYFYFCLCHLSSTGKGNGAPNKIVYSPHNNGIGPYLHIDRGSDIWDQLALHPKIVFPCPFVFADQLPQTLYGIANPLKSKRENEYL